ncbi:MAG: Na+/H+ antiporter subunit E [Lachnospiraceae bacterium]|nr:Na+/H+ antiporter subunit E [Lachnospiraceae bacterium]
MFFVLLLLWIAFNGRFTVEVLLFGIVISALLYAFMCKFMGFSPKKELIAFKKTGSWLKFYFIVFVEIIKANLQVIFYIYNASIEVEPRVVTFKKKFKDKANNSRLANSITLTPGTITVSLEKDEYVVHCLDKSLGTDLDSSVFVKQLDKIEGR